MDDDQGRVATEHDRHPADPVGQRPAGDRENEVRQADVDREQGEAADGYLFPVLQEQGEEAVADDGETGHVRRGEQSSCGCGAQ
ncbi:hypothetical protein [Streptomyces chartreusis]|uniref:Uncharacterized protein n=1 Tax=Streptomyces chartreusis TaxID=1969 RepID=A0A7I0Y906_STRCX|nr:hypothetical protein [Streptomyces chartreusis]QKZ15987.1 hypothetical protein HUT05_00340 [Streptomyces chartreusis]